jgi:hypothetical protein
MGKTRMIFCLGRLLSRLGFFFIPNAKPWDKFDRLNVEIGDNEERLKR